MKSVMAILGIAIAAVLLSMLFGKSKDLSPDPVGRAEEKKQAEEKASMLKQRKLEIEAEGKVPFEPNMEGVVNAVVKVAGKGEIALEMYPKEAPETVAKFKSLIEKKYYDGLSIHRVEPDFVVQWGMPQARKKAFDDVPFVETTIPFEKNKLKHVEGTIAVALKSPGSDTGSSELFINLMRNKSLDEGYCVFGRVTNGMDVVKKIQPGDVIESITLK